MTCAKNGKTDHCHCNRFGKDLSIRHKGRADIEKHLETKEHIVNCKKVAGTKTFDQLFSGSVFKFAVFTRNFFVLFPGAHIFVLIEHFIRKQKNRT